jgi:hypothetical protein
MKKACFSINRKKEYVTIYNSGCIYPLPLWNKYRAMHDFTHQQVADMLLSEYEREVKDHV